MHSAVGSAKQIGAAQGAAWVFASTEYPVLSEVIGWYIAVGRYIEWKGGASGPPDARAEFSGFSR